VTAARQRMSARDYKHAGRSRSSSFDIRQYQQFGIGLAAGLAVALVVWLYDHRAQPAAADELAEVTAPAERAGKTAAKQSAAAETAEDPASDYAFYDMLPKFEVTVPERDLGVRRDLPTQPITAPGAYVLQVASSRNRPDAERLVEKLAKLGIEAGIQHVSIDADEWHRVRIGPISELAKLNATRKTLRAADIDAIIYRVGD
jgi:cell division protein FtsN